MFELQRQNHILEAKVRERTAQLSFANQELQQEVAERKQVEEALRCNEEKFRQLAENIQSVFWMNNVDMTQMIYVSPAYEKIWGRPCAQLYASAKSWLDAVYPEDRDRVMALLPQQRYGEYEAEYRIIRPDGKVRWIRDRSFPIRDATGQVYRLVGTAEDISDRKQVEEELRRSEERWQLVLQGNNDGIWDLNLKTNECFRSARFLEILGYFDQELSMSNDEWKRRIHPDDLERVMQANQDYLERKTPYYSVEYRLRCKDGSYKWVLGRAQAVWDEAGNPIRMVGSTTDISDYKQAEEALRDSEQQFRQIFQDASIGMALADFQTHRFIQVNPAWCQLLGYSASELTSLTFDQISHPDDLPHDLHCLEQGRQGKLDSYRLEKRYFKKNGELMWAKLTVTILTEQDGKPRFSLAMVEDITEQRQAEDKLRAALLEKETLIKEIHHRVKNNLQVISSLLRLQSRQIRDQPTLELFKESQNRIQAMALIHEKLYQSSNLAQIDFREYITTLVGNLCRSYDIHRQAITFKINVEQVSLAIDTAISCGLIINELVTNSLKYAFGEFQGGEICITLQCDDSPLTVSEDTKRFILSVSDNGIGLPEDLDFRNTSSLGLQLVCRLTKQLGGSIELNRSQGTDFRIAFIKPNDT